MNLHTYMYTVCIFLNLQINRVLISNSEQNAIFHICGRGTFSAFGNGKIHMRIHINICKYYIYIYSYTCIHIHTHIYTYVYRCSCIHIKSLNGFQVHVFKDYICIHRRIHIECVNTLDYITVYVFL